MFLDLFIFTDAVHVSGGSSAQYQEHANAIQYVQLCASAIGLRNRQKHVERL
jgi:hypothetical protein